MKRITIILVLCLLTGGCAIGTTQIEVGHDPLEQIVQKRQGNIMVEPFVDGRKDKEFIGNKRNGFGMVLGHIGMQENVKLEDLLTKFFSEALVEAGYNIQNVNVSPSNSAKIDLIVGGEITEFQLDLYMAVWHDVTVKLKSFDPDTRKITWEKEVKGHEANTLWIGATGEYERVIRSSLTKALNEAAKEFAGDEFNKLLKK
jgi:hypothetical protein